MSSSLAVTHSSAQASASLPAFWMSPDLVWTVFLLLLGMSLLVSLRYDWLKIWWQDQLRRMTGAQAAEDDLSASFALPEPTRPRSRPQPAPPIHATRTGPTPPVQHTPPTDSPAAPSTPPELPPTGPIAPSATTVAGPMP
ncbi:hypothetical protein OU995_04915 [Roseateles sp. SL47]|uniref:hypothetical protein n=1 Tax=Roseateles sp. SL47 TaxID=2995138 RepID=UPI00226E93E0|nr:hypothetical protein [Roseateles sp. SL47]WAC74074.1 hypothetical protein OU995_04915 [Roseateles sp. SL47]